MTQRVRTSFLSKARILWPILPSVTYRSDSASHFENRSPAKSERIRAHIDFQRRTPSAMSHLAGILDPSLFSHLLFLSRIITILRRKYRSALMRAANGESIKEINTVNEIASNIFFFFRISADKRMNDTLAYAYSIFGLLSGNRSWSYARS